MTAEFAVALPGVLIGLALCLGGVQAAAQQARLADAAAVAARMLGRGETPPGSSAGVADQSVDSERGMVCVTMTAPSGVAGFGGLGITVRARACVLDERELG